MRLEARDGKVPAARDTVITRSSMRSASDVKTCTTRPRLSQTVVVVAPRAGSRIVANTRQVRAGVGGGGGGAWEPSDCDGPERRSAAAEYEKSNMVTLMR